MATQTAAREPFFSFPHPVNEYSARFVATGVVAFASATIILGHTLGWHWMTVPLAYGFLARVLTGPKLSPLGLFVTKWLVPRLGLNRPVAGPPKRFAQFLGLCFSTTAAVLALGLGQVGAAWVVLGMLIGAASLEAGLNFCLGCRIFSILMKVGVIPRSICADCADFEARNRRASAQGKA